MAKPPKKQATPKTPEQAMTELVELSQELGLYDITDNPLVKDAATMPLEAPTEPLQAIAEETDPTVAQIEETPSSIGLEPLNATEQLGELLDGITEESKHPEIIPTVELDSPPVDDKLTLKDGWGQVIPTKLVVIQSMNYTDLVAQMLFAGYLGGQLDSSFRILSTVPFRIRVLMPEDQYENFLSKENQPVFDEDLTYNRVLVKSWDLYGFWKAIINIGKNGGIVQPRQVAQKRPMYMVPILTRAPVKDTPESRLSRIKVAYTKDELESFSLEDLRIVASWYEGIPSMNAKKGYIKEILIKQGN